MSTIKVASPRYHNVFKLGAQSGLSETLFRPREELLPKEEAKKTSTCFLWSRKRFGNFRQSLGRMDFAKVFLVFVLLPSWPG